MGNELPEGTWWLMKVDSDCCMSVSMKHKGLGYTVFGPRERGVTLYTLRFTVLQRSHSLAATEDVLYTSYRP